MNNVKLDWTSFALKSLDEIKDCIEQETRSETIAIKYINKLIDRAEQLQNFPDSGSEEQLLKHLKQNSRYIVEGNYKIIYQHRNNQVIITDVFHTKQYPVEIIKRHKR